MTTDWQTLRLGFAIIAGAVLLVVGVIRDDAAVMTVGAGLIGFSPAAKGP
jgi:hypothetical protein